MDAATLDACTGCGIMVAQSWADPLSAAMARATIVTPLRQAAFLAQVAYESAVLSVLQENLDYSAEGLLATFPKYFDADSAAQYARQPARIASHVYANRMGNGPEATGDGWMYRGRGLLMITGRQNYRDFSAWVVTSVFEANPDGLLRFDVAALAAAWFWQSRDLNILADTQDFRAITKSINGGQNGAEGRESLYQHARAALAIARWNPLG